MERQTARSARALVTPERSASARARGMVTRIVAILVLVAVVYLTVAIATGKAAAAPEINPATRSEPVKSSAKSFITPSGRFACTSEKFGSKHFLICDVRAIDDAGTGTLPTVDGQTITAICKKEAPGEWGNGVTLTPKKKATANCSTGVNVINQHPPKLAYGTRWKRDGFVCLSLSDALRCSNASGAHGFRINKDVLKLY